MLSRGTPTRTTALLCLTLLGACLHGADDGRPSPTRVDSARAAALGRRADSLVRRLFADPRLAVLAAAGITPRDSVLPADRPIVDEIERLESYAAPALIECLADVRPSPVIVWDTNITSAMRPLRGAVCGQMLREMNVLRVSDRDLFAQAAALTGCVRPRGYLWCPAVIPELDAPPDTLRRAHAIWTTYWEARTARAEPLSPELARHAVGCYVLTLLSDPGDWRRFPTPHRLLVALDSLPLPGTVRSAPVVLSDSIRFEGPATWRTLGEERVEITWGGPWEHQFFGVWLATRPGYLTRYWIRVGEPGIPTSIFTSGPVQAKRIGCRAMRAGGIP